MKIDIKTARKKYGLVYTDPPWAQTKGNLRSCRPNQKKALDYPTLSLPEIKEIHKTVTERLVLPKHDVFMWTIDKYLRETEDMMKDLGYCLHARMVWDKGNGVAPAFTVRFSHEYLLWFYKRGQMLKPAENTAGKYPTVFKEPSTVHSRKPECAYVMLEEMFPDTPKLELFARRIRDGWDCFGNEV